MRNIKFMLIFCIFILNSFFVLNSSADESLKIVSSEVINNSEFVIKYSDEVVITDEAKITLVETKNDIIKDVSITSEWKIIFSLSEPLTNGYTYSFLVSDGSSELSIRINYSDKEVSYFNDDLLKNENSDNQGISYLAVLDDNKFELELLYDFWEFNIKEYSLIRELKIKNTTLNSWNELLVSLDDNLEVWKNYLFASIWLTDVNWVKIPYENSFFSFNLPEENIETEVVSEENTSDTNIQKEEEIELNSAKENVVEDQSINTEDAIDVVTKTPDTWTPLNILIVLTFLVTLLFIFRSKLKFN